MIHNEFCTKILIFRFRSITREEHLPNRLFEEAKGPIMLLQKKMTFVSPKFAQKLQNFVDEMNDFSLTSLVKNVARF